MKDKNSIINFFRFNNLLKCRIGKIPREIIIKIEEILQEKRDYFSKGFKLEKELEENSRKNCTHCHDLYIKHAKKVDWDPYEMDEFEWPRCAERQKILKEKERRKKELEKELNELVEPHNTKCLILELIEEYPNTFRAYRKKKRK